MPQSGSSLPSSGVLAPRTPRQAGPSACGCARCDPEDRRRSSPAHGSIASASDVEWCRTPPRWDRRTSMSDAPLLMEKDGAIGWLIFNRPDKRNAVGIETWQLMPDYVKDLAADDAIRVVILRGAGDKAFVAGADISQFKDRRRNMEDEA